MPSALIFILKIYRIITEQHKNDNSVHYPTAVMFKNAPVRLNLGNANHFRVLYLVYPETLVPMESVQIGSGF